MAEQSNSTGFKQRQHAVPGLRISSERRRPSKCSIHQKILVLAFGLLLVVARSNLAADKFVIEPAERWSNVFAESETRWKYRFVGDRRPNRGQWRLTINHRTAATGEFELVGAADQPVERTIALIWPNVNAHSVLTALLTVSAGEAVHDRAVRIFSRNAFADRNEWLKMQKIRLFDLEGETATRLKDAGIPFERIRTQDDLADVAEGIVIVAEGMSLGKEGNLIERLRRTADRGARILCLAAKDGEISFPGKNHEPLSVQLRRADVIRELDKHLDSAWWSGGASQRSGLRLVSTAGDVSASITSDAKSWPWCEWTYESPSNQTSRFIFCGFGVIRSWDDGPTARYLFLRLLERLAESTDSSTKVAEKP